MNQTKPINALMRRAEKHGTCDYQFLICMFNGFDVDVRRRFLNDAINARGSRDRFHGVLTAHEETILPRRYRV